MRCTHASPPPPPPPVSNAFLERPPPPSGTEMGKAAKAVMESGGLVPDEIVVGIIKDSIGQPE